MRIIAAAGLGVLLLAGCADMENNPKQVLGTLGGLDLLVNARDHRGERVLR